MNITDERTIDVLTLAGTAGECTFLPSIPDHLMGENPASTEKDFGTTGPKLYPEGFRQYCRKGQKMKNIRGFLIDLDGVLYVGNQVIRGARESITHLRERKYKFRFVSNTTRRSRKSVAERLSSMGFDIPVEYIFTPSIATVAYIKNSGKHHCYILTTGDVHQDFEQECICDNSALVDHVILGDAGDRVTYGTLNSAFRHLMQGADLIALENDRYWMAPDGLSLSAGPFVQALEFATGKTAKIMGKPSKTFFELALSDMGLRADEVAMIGDDILTDIGGARSMGMQGILVRTGKFRKDALENAVVKPSCIIESIAQLQDIL